MINNNDDDTLRRAEALAQSPEPTAEMIAATDAEASAPILAQLSISEEVSGGADAMYLREIANHGLLNQQDEIALAQKMEAGHAAADRLNAADGLSEYETNRLRQLVEDGEQARRTL